MPSSRTPGSRTQGSGDDEPRWGPATTYRASPSGRRRQARSDAGPAVAAPAAPTRRGYDRYDDEDDGYGSHDGYDDGYGSDDGYGPASSYGRSRPSGGRTAPPPRQAAAPRRRRRRPGRTVAVVLVLLLVVAAAYPLLLARTASQNVHRVDALSGSSLADTPGRTILVVGSDTRDGTDLEAVEGARTDTILLLHRPRTGPTVLLSIPRDSLVEIPGYGDNKVNAAYTFGGPPLLVQTVEQATGVHVDDYVETGLAGFGQVVDAVGGITICPTRDMVDPMSGLDVRPGCQPADGTTSLAYARSRYEDPLGDLGRAQRQREVMAAIADKAFTPSTVLNPFTSFPLAKAGGNALTMDETDSTADLGWFLLAMRDSAGGDGLSLTVPVADTTRRTEHGVVVDWDEEQAETVFQALRDSSTEAVRPIAEAQQAALQPGG